MPRVPWQPMGTPAERLVARLTNAIHAYEDEVPDPEKSYVDMLEAAKEGDKYCAEVDQAVSRMHARDMGR